MTDMVKALWIGNGILKKILKIGGNNCEYFFK